MKGSYNYFEYVKTMINGMMQKNKDLKMNSCSIKRW